MYAVGIDVSKGKSTIAIATTEGEVIDGPFEINHDQDGFDILLSKVKKFPFSFAESNINLLRY